MLKKCFFNTNEIKLKDPLRNKYIIKNLKKKRNLTDILRTKYIKIRFRYINKKQNKVTNIFKKHCLTVLGHTNRITN